MLFCKCLNQAIIHFLFYTHFTNIYASMYIDFYKVKVLQSHKVSSNSIEKQKFYISSLFICKQTADTTNQFSSPPQV